MYGSKVRGLLDTLLWQMREWYPSAWARRSSRQIWTYYELLPFLDERPQGSWSLLLPHSRYSIY